MLRTQRPQTIAGRPARLVQQHIQDNIGAGPLH